MGESCMKHTPVRLINPGSTRYRRRLTRTFFSGFTSLGIIVIRLLFSLIVTQLACPTQHRPLLQNQFPTKPSSRDTKVVIFYTLPTTETITHHTMTSQSSHHGMIFSPLISCCVQREEVVLQPGQVYQTGQVDKSTRFVFRRMHNFDSFMTKAIVWNEFTRCSRQCTVI